MASVIKYSLCIIKKLLVGANCLEVQIAFIHYAANQVCDMPPQIGYLLQKYHLKDLQ